ncbi:hypothetical protein ACSBR1_035356 [Camellia fascicularis]
MKFIVDVFMDKYWMLVISSFAYSALCKPHSIIRLCLLKHKTSLLAGFGIPNNVNTSSPRQGHSHLQSIRARMHGEGQKILFYTVVALVAIGVSGHLISLSTFMVEQLTKVFRDNFTTHSCLSLFLGTNIAILIPIGGIIAISFIKI